MRAEEAKRVRYPAVAAAGLRAVEPFAVESFGRLGKGALRLLHRARQRALERDSTLRGWAGVALFNRWLGVLSCSLQQSMFDAVQAMLGNRGQLRTTVREPLPLLLAALPFA
eukprot:10781225-Karenia_brevis.AAC.1